MGPMTTPRIVKQAERPDLYAHLAQPIDITPTARPVSQLRGTRDYGQVLHQIRALLVSAVTALVVIILLLAVLVDHMKAPRPGTVAEFPTPAAVTLSLSGDPAPDYMAHVVLADGTERDVQLGSYLLDNPVRIILHANSPERGETWCRIGLRGVLVASEASQGGGTATCEWRLS
jgi:hypothetical protein